MTTQRFSIYANIHKAIRLMLGELVAEAGRMDVASTAEVEAMRARIHDTVELLEAHAHHEDLFVMPLVRLHAPTLAAKLEGAHAEQEGQLAALCALGDEVSAAPLEVRPSLARGLVVMLARVVGELFTHMSDEEQHAMGALWAVYTDAELFAVDQQIVASLDPREMQRWLPFILSGLAPTERYEMLSGVRAAAPPEVFAAITGLAQRILPSPAWQRLSADLAA